MVNHLVKQYTTVKPACQDLLYKMERVTGFEPVSLAWKAKAQPIDQTRIIQQFGGECGIRTHGPFYRSFAFQANAIGHSANSPYLLSASLKVLALARSG